MVRLCRLAIVLVALLGCAAQAKVQQTDTLLIGGDVSTLTLMEHHGARYFNRNGQQQDALQILKQNGSNIVRLRLYVQPGSGHGAGGYYWPKESMNLADVLVLAKRASDLHMQIELTLHYSDFWTDSKSQTLPLSWTAELKELPDEAARFERLRALVYDHTRQALLAMQAQGTTPQFVSIGNEIEMGMLYPYGRANAEHWPQLAALLEAGSSAVKSVAPTTRVVIHLDDAGNSAKYQDYFDHLRKLQVHWDVIGTSYYPFWSRRRIGEVMDFCSAMSARYDKDVLIMETGFNWTPNRADGYPGQLSDNGPYPDSMSSPAGQLAFMRELLGAIRHTPRVLGLLYWDPIMIATPGVGWAVREYDDEAAENVVSNTTLFDFTGHALPILDSWRELTHRFNLNENSHEQPTSR